MSAPDGGADLPASSFAALTAAVAEVEQFAADAGWDRPPRLFALVDTQQLRAAQPDLAGHLATGGALTPIAQDELPPGDLEQFLGTISWPPEVAGCALVQEIIVLPPGALGQDSQADDEPEIAPDSAGSRDDRSRVADPADLAAGHPDRTEARLVAGVLRGSEDGACLLRLRDGAHAGTVISDPGLAPNLVAALHATLL